MFVRIEAIVEHQGVVLVGEQQLFVAGHGAGDHEAVGHRRRAELLLGQLQQALAEGAADAAHGAADHMCAGVVGDHPYEGGAQVRQQALEPLHRGLVEDAIDQIQAAA